MDSYFFIPASQNKFIENRERLKANFFVFDFEDSINQANLIDALENCRNIKILPNYYARLYWNPYDRVTSKKAVKDIIKLGFRNFIVPKFRSLEELETIYKMITPAIKEDSKIALLFENPKSILIINEIFKKFDLCGISLGSHDYCASMGMLHTKENIYWARHLLLNYAKAGEINFIDIASMNISNEVLFAEECKEAFDLGCDGKFIIHPKQLDIFNSTKYFGDRDLETALEVREIINTLGGRSNFTILNLKGQIIEKPHLDRYNKILKMAGYETF